MVHVSVPKPLRGATRRQGNADLRSAQPAAGGRREGPRVRGWFASRPGPRRSASSGRLGGTRLRCASRSGADRRSASPCLRRHPDCWGFRRGCIFTATAQRSAQFSRWGLPCLRVAPPGGMGAMRQFSVRVAPSATRRALPRLRNPGWSRGEPEGQAKRLDLHSLALMGPVGAPNCGSGPRCRSAGVGQWASVSATPSCRNRTAFPPDPSRPAPTGRLSPRRGRSPRYPGSACGDTRASRRDSSATRPSPGTGRG